MSHFNRLDEKTLREMLSRTIADLAKNPQDTTLRKQKRGIEEEIAYIQHFGKSRKRRGYR